WKMLVHFPRTQQIYQPFNQGSNKFSNHLTKGPLPSNFQAFTKPTRKCLYISKDPTNFPTIFQVPEKTPKLFQPFSKPTRKCLYIFQGPNKFSNHFSSPRKNTQAFPTL